MNKSTIFVCSLLLVVGGIWSLSAFDTKEEVAEVAPVEEKIEWISMEEAMKRHEKEPRFWIIDVYTDWCGWCKRMDAVTFVDPHIVKEIQTNYYAVKLDAEQKEDIVIKDHTYKFVNEGRRGYHELAAELLQGRMSYPTVVFLDKNANIIQPLPGYQEPPQLLPILNYFSSLAYQNTAWAEYQAAFQSPYPATETVNPN
jgi:thioredoxin-related protein